MLAPDTDVMVKTTVFDWFYGYREPDFVRPKLPTADAYARIQKMAQTVIETFTVEGAVDMIDAHGIMWTCAKVHADLVVTDAKRAEFVSLFTEFLQEYPDSPDGLIHRQRYITDRVQGVENLKVSLALAQVESTLHMPLRSIVRQQEHTGEQAISGARPSRTTWPNAYQRVLGRHDFSRGVLFVLRCVGNRGAHLFLKRVRV